MNLNDLPSFLKESQLYDVLSENYENGIIDQNELNQLSQYIISNDKVENIEEFKKVFDVEHYWGVDDYSLSLYAYSIFHRDEVLNYLSSLIVSEGQSEKYKSFYDDIFYSTFILENPRLMIKYLKRNYKKSPELNEICKELLLPNVDIKYDSKNSSLIFYLSGVPVASFYITIYQEYNEDEDEDEDEDEQQTNDQEDSRAFDLNTFIQNFVNKKNTRQYLSLDLDYFIYFLADKNLLIIKNNKEDSFFQIKLTRFNMPNILFCLNKILQDVILEKEDSNFNTNEKVIHYFRHLTIPRSGFSEIEIIPDKILKKWNETNVLLWKNFNEDGFTSTIINNTYEEKGQIYELL